MGEGKQITIEPGARRGSVAAPRSKSHEHRLLLADFLAGDYSRLAPAEGDADDIQATKRCLLALAGDDTAPFLDCGESGSTRRFLAPIAAALGKRPVFQTAGRLADRPQMDYDDLQPGEFKLAGDVSSQFVTGLLFALPLLKGDSFIRFTSPLESKGYVEMTRRVLVGAGVFIGVRDDGYDIPGGCGSRSRTGRRRWRTSSSASARRLRAGRTSSRFVARRGLSAAARSRPTATTASRWRRRSGRRTPRRR